MGLSVYPSICLTRNQIRYVKYICYTDFMVPLERKSQVDTGKAM